MVKSDDRPAGASRLSQEKRNGHNEDPHQDCYGDHPPALPQASSFGCRRIHWPAYFLPVCPLYLISGRRRACCFIICSQRCRCRIGPCDFVSAPATIDVCSQLIDVMVTSHLHTRHEEPIELSFVFGEGSFLVCIELG